MHLRAVLLAGWLLMSLVVAGDAPDAVAQGAPASPTAHAASSGACPSLTEGVTVVVDFRAFGGSIHVRCAPGAPSSGLSALTGAGFGHEFVPRIPGMVCRIAALPDPCNGAPADAYWSYHHGSRGGAWSYSNEGAGTRSPPVGSVEGWAFGSGQPPSSPPPPPPLPTSSAPTTAAPTTAALTTPAPTAAPAAPAPTAPAPTAAAPSEPAPPAPPAATSPTSRPPSVPPATSRPGRSPGEDGPATRGGSDRSVSGQAPMTAAEPDLDELAALSNSSSTGGGPGAASALIAMPVIAAIGALALRRARSNRTDPGLEDVGW